MKEEDAARGRGGHKFRCHILHNAGFVYLTVWGS